MMAPYTPPAAAVDGRINQEENQKENEQLLHQPQYTSAARPNYYFSYERALARRTPASEKILTEISTNDGSGTLKPNKLSYLPYVLPWHTTAGIQEAPADFGWIMESCGGKAAMGIFGGGCMGLLLGVFLGAMSDMNPPLSVINGKDVPTAPLKEQMRTSFRATAEKSMYWCRNFAFITGVFGGSECLVEKFRGKHDQWNPVLSGCITGASLQAKAGPQAAALGCGGFAVFSLAIEQFMGNY
eukprot:CAMPEP_0195518744 /NCGR_PEP_ID=MMETSP0794_2-20130614/13590_1 /TAXON_ID=515487 /ORGANISM="Stephanopyxis turris, Strain CCMP 815" /LENGTH=241 /DNA_ID=CAMNT_0040647765 /DNA_START=105 /DNA_END=830 /DNA_ORIENTATION=+